MLDENFVKKIKKDLKKIDLLISRIGIDASPKIFLCGGPYKDEETTKNNFSTKPLPCTLSSRYRLIDQLKKQNNNFYPQIIIADAFKFRDWYIKGKYKDLLTLEKDIAEMSGLIVIIPESPGSIAELGSFIMLKSIKKKLLIFIKDTHAEKESFIWNGIIENFQQNTSQQVFIGRESDIEGMQDDIQKFLEKITKEIQKMAGSSKFDNKKKSHQAFFIYEMIRVYGALEIQEIGICLKAVNLLGINMKKIKNLLFILEEFKWIKKTSKGNKKFYYIPKGGQKIGKTEFKMNILEKNTKTPKFVAWNTDYIQKLALSFYNGGRDKLHRDRYNVIKSNGNS